MGKLIGGITLTVLALFGYYIACMNHVNLQHIGIAYDAWDGSVYVQKPGWHQTRATVRVAEVSLLPTRVCVSGGIRQLNCKLVRFKAEGVEAFIAEQGFHYYNSGATTTNSNSDCGRCDGMTRILKGYAYSGKEWPFLEVMEETVLREKQ